MALQTSGQISLSNLIAEFGGGVRLTDFYRGGAYVPNTTANNGVPTSGQIKLTDFYGATAVSNHTVAPDNYFANAANGTHTFYIASNVQNGKGPFTYSWTWESGGFGMSISDGTSPTCRIDSTGTNVYRNGVLKCTVVDQGNNNLTVAGTSTIDVQHGTPQ